VTGELSGNVGPHNAIQLQHGERAVYGELPTCMKRSPNIITSKI